MSPGIQFQQDQIRCRVEDNEAAAYIVFTNISPNIVENSEYNPHIIGGKNIRIFYDESLRQLIPRWLQDRMKSRGGTVGLYIFQQIRVHGSWTRSSGNWYEANQGIPVQ